MPICNYLYAHNVSCATGTNAPEALRSERRLEFGMEGYSFFDLVRWGIAADVLNNYFDKEKTKIKHVEYI